MILSPATRADLVSALSVARSVDHGYNCKGGVAGRPCKCGRNVVVGWLSKFLAGNSGPRND